MKTKFLFHTICLVLLLTVLTGCGSRYHYIPVEDPGPPPPFYVPERIKVALVLGSGGVRGMAHVGVLEELEAADISVDLIVGCSAGSFVGALYADNRTVDEIKYAVSSIRGQSLLDIDIFHCRYGISQGTNMKRILDNCLIAENFNELKIPLVVVASDLHSGELVPIGSGDLVKAVQSSCSIPFLFVPCEHLGRVLVDGGVVNPVPVKVAKDLGADIIIAVDLCELLPKTFPSNLFEIATRSAEIAFMWQNEVCTRHADVTIKPATCGVGTFNDKMKWKIYQAGRNAAREQIPRIKELLAKLQESDRPESTEIRLVQPCCYTPQICRE